MDIIEFLRQNENTRKLFGKKEIDIIEKQINGLILTQSEKNRLSRDVRKKFEFIRELGRYNFDLNLKKGSKINQIIDESKEVILTSGFKGIMKIILFGSTVENKRTANSDIDLAVKFDKISLEEATKFRVFVSGRINDKVDVQVYNILDKKIKKEIDVKGRVIWEE